MYESSINSVCTLSTTLKHTQKIHNSFTSLSKAPQYRRIHEVKSNVMPQNHHCLHYGFKQNTTIQVPMTKTFVWAHTQIYEHIAWVKMSHWQWPGGKQSWVSYVEIMKNERHTEASLMRANCDVITSIHMRVSRQMSYCPPLVDYTPLERRSNWLQKHMQMSLINMHFIQIKI